MTIEAEAPAPTRTDEIADGIYIGLDVKAYVRDRALSGSGFEKLLTEPAGLYWAHPDNPLYDEPTPASRRPQLRGSASHCAALEGLDAYERAYVVPPEGAMTSDDDLKEFIRAARAKLEAQLGAKLGREEAKPFLLGGDKAELIARVKALDPNANVWDPRADARETLAPSDDKYVRIVERFLRSDKTVAPYITGGVPEVSIFWTETVRGRRVRFKCRPDYITTHTVLDKKTYGRPPMRGRSLREHCVKEAAYKGADLQAVHNARGVAVAGDLYRAGKLQIHSDDSAKSALLVKLFEAHATTAPVFRWLFVRMGGAPSSIIVPFRESDGHWQEVEQDIADAVATYLEYVEACGDGLWMASAGEHEIQDMDWPMNIIRGV